jgi:hypothetical protein
MYLPTSTGRRGKSLLTLVTKNLYFLHVILIVSVRSATIIRSQNSLLKIQIVIKIVQGLNYHLILLVLKIVYTWHSNKMP